MATIDNERLVRADPDALYQAIHKKKISDEVAALFIYWYGSWRGQNLCHVACGTEARRSGVDVVVGVVESHGREENASVT